MYKIPYFWDFKIAVFRVDSIINAKDDPVLTGDCYPYEQVKDNKYIYLETPDYGGHCGFVTMKGEFWDITRAISFINNN